MEDSVTLAFKLIAAFEGCRLSPYRCPAGYWTIGYGSTTLEDGSAVSADTPPITQVQADTLLTRSILSLIDRLGDVVQVLLTAPQTAALTSFAYNVGFHAFATSALLKNLNKGNIAATADAFLDWDKTHVNGNAVTMSGLLRRREAERSLFLSNSI